MITDQTPDTPTASTATKKKRVGDSAAVQPTPYQMQASSELSREFFLTDQVKIQSGDQVLPFINPLNGHQVEALVFSGGNLSHLRRDASTPTGWSFNAFYLQGMYDSVSNVAVAANGSDVWVLLFGQPSSQNPSEDQAWLTRLNSATTWDDGAFIDIEGSTLTRPFKGGVSRDGACYFSTTWVDGTTTTVGGWIATGSSPTDPEDALSYQQLAQLDTSSHQLQDYTVLYDARGNSDPSNPTGFLLALTDDGVLASYPQDGLAFGPDPMTSVGAEHVTTLMWAWASPTSTTGMPGYAFQTASGSAFVDENGNYNTVTDIALAGNNEATVWQQNGLYTVNLLDKDGTLQMIQELSSSGTGSWASPIPLVPDVAAVFGVPTDPTESTLFLVGLDESLSVLSLGGTGWLQTQIHQDGEELYDLAAYRIQARVSDANDVAVPGAYVIVWTDRPVGCWTPNGYIPITPDAPATVITDVKGEVTVSIPAQELDCATLTLVAYDTNGQATGNTFRITADGDVRGFLGGTGSLADKGTISGGALQGATLPGTSTKLFAGLTDSDSADASVKALAAAIKVGTDADNRTTSSAAGFSLDLSSGKPAFGNTVSKAKLGGKELTFSFGHLFASIGHALRHGAMALSTAVIHLAEDGIHWAVDLTVKIGDELVNFANLVITDMKDAFHVIGGFFATIGADIKNAVEWLMHDVVALLESAKTTASTIQGWLGTDGVTGNVTEVLDALEFDTDTWFYDKEQDAHNAISTLKNEVEGTLGGPPLPPPTSDSGSSSDQSSLAKDFSFLGKVMSDAPGTWLLHKLLSYLPAGDAGPSLDQDTLLPLLQDVIDDWIKGITFSEALVTFGETTLIDAFSTDGVGDKAKLDNAKVSDWFEQLDGVVDNGLQLLDKVADTLLDLVKAGVAAIQTFLDYQYNLVSSMGILGLILELADVDIHFSLAEILSWIVAFPATLIAKIRGYNAVFPSSISAQATAHHGHHALGKDPDGWQVGLGISAAVTQGIWGFADLVGDLQQFYNSDSGKRGEASNLIGYIDIIAPVIETLLLWPSDPNDDGSTAPPFTGDGHGHLAGSTTHYEYLPYIVTVAFLPSAVSAISMAPWAGSANGIGVPEGVQNVAKDYLNPLVQMVCGIISTVLGSLYSSANNAGSSAIAGTVLGNVSYVFAPLATYWMNSTTDDLSTVLKMLVDAGGNIGAAVCIAEATSLPTP